MSPHFTDIMDDSSDTSSSAQATLQNGHSVAHTHVINGSASLDVKPLGHATANGVNGLSNGANGHSMAPQINGHAATLKTPYLQPAAADEVHDLVCVGFGPASLAIAVAMHDAREAGTLKAPPKVRFLEKQTQFAWHAGMLLPGAKMQISFIKDMASLRNPRSHFTFLNYLHQNDRLVEFTNLDTFLPARVEYEDYLRWCARHFDDLVHYENEVLSVAPVKESGPLKMFTVTARNATTGEVMCYKARNVVLAVGGQPSVPKLFPAQSPRVVHSSQYAQNVPQLLRDPSASYRVAVIGAGQSAAEIFNNVQGLYPNSKTYMVMRSEFLKPSDDSPFVNSIFNPAFVDTIHSKPSAYRASLLHDARATNYGVVRLELIEHLYEKMYHQRRTLGVDEKKWPHRILAGRKIVKVGEKGDKLHIKVALCPGGEEENNDGPLLDEEDLEVDLVICATGYQRRAHLEMLKDTWSLLPEVDATTSKVGATKDGWLVETAGEGSQTSVRSLEVGRDYGVRFSAGAVAQGSGVWLQGCCEGTHGLSDTLLSVLSTRSGEMVESIFGASSH